MRDFANSAKTSRRQRNGSDALNFLTSASGNSAGGVLVMKDRTTVNQLISHAYLLIRMLSFTTCIESDTLQIFL